MHYLYRITNLPNKKVYIGQTVNDKKRWVQHKRLAMSPDKTGQYIHRAMFKYGVENFIYEVIAQCITQYDANEIEAQLIIQKDSINKGKDWNI